MSWMWKHFKLIIYRIIGVRCARPIFVILTPTWWRFSLAAFQNDKWTTFTGMFSALNDLQIFSFLIFIYLFVCFLIHWILCSVKFNQTEQQENKIWFWFGLSTRIESCGSFLALWGNLLKFSEEPESAVEFIKPINLSFDASRYFITFHNFNMFIMRTKWPCFLGNRNVLDWWVFMKKDHIFFFVEYESII